MSKANTVVSEVRSIFLTLLALCVFLGGTARAAVYYMKTPVEGADVTHDWTDTIWYNYETGASGTQATLDANSDYYIGNESTDAHRTRISTWSAFGGKTLYIGINPDGSFPTTSDFVNGASTLLVGLNSNSTLQFADDIQIGNGILAFTGNGNVSNAVLTGKTANAKITVADGTTNTVLRAWASNDKRTFTLDIPITGGAGSKMYVYTLKNDQSQFLGEIILNQDNSGYTGSWELTKLTVLTAQAENALGSSSSDVTLQKMATLNVNADQSIGNLKTSAYESTGLDEERILTANNNIVKTEKDTRKVNVGANATLSAKSVALQAKDSLNLADGATLSITEGGNLGSTPVVGGTTTTLEAANDGTSSLDVNLGSANVTNFKGTYQTADGAKMKLSSAAVMDVSNALNAGAGSTMELELKTVTGNNRCLNFNGAVTGTGTISINTNQSATGNTDDRRIYINKASNAFTGTWDVQDKSFFYGGAAATTTESNFLGGGTYGSTGSKPSVILGQGAKLIQNGNQEYENVTVNGSGATLTMVNGKTSKISDTLTVWSDTKINASTDYPALSLSGNGTAASNVKTLYAKNIVLNADDTAGSATFYVGHYPNNSTNYPGYLYVNTVGTAAVPATGGNDAIPARNIDIILRAGEVGPYDSTSKITVNGNFITGGNESATHRLVLNVTEGENAMEVSGTFRLWKDLTIDASSQVTLTTNKPTQIISFNLYEVKETGRELVLGENLSGNEMYVGAKGVYLGASQDDFHKYYRVGNAWKRYGMESETANVQDTQGTYYLKQGDGTVSVPGFQGKAMYVGYDVATGQISGSKTDPGTTNPTLLIENLNTELHLGVGGAYASSGDGNTLHGTIITEDGTDFVIRMNNTEGASRLLTINSAISGPGTLTLTGRTNTSYKTVSRINLTGDNSDFTGTMNILNEIAVFADGENSLGSGTVTMNPATIKDQNGNNPVTVGKSRLWVGADQNLEKLTYNMTDAASYIAVDENATLKVNTLELGGDFTFDDRTETFPQFDGSSFTKSYTAGTIDAANITKAAAAGNPTAFNLSSGTLKIGTVGEGINLNQTGGVLAASDSATDRLMEIYGDYDQTGGTLLLTFDTEGNDLLYVHGALTLDSLTLFGEDGFTLDDSEYTPILKTTYNPNADDPDKVFDLNLVATALEGALAGKDVTFAYDAATLTWGVRAMGGGEGGAVPEPATWVLLVLGLCGAVALRRKK